MPAAAFAPAPGTTTALSREALESLLRQRKLDHTLTKGFPAADAGFLIPTGSAALDARLQGGLPRGHLSELVGPRSSGRLAVAVSAMAGAASRGEAVALIDPLDMFDPASAAASGLDFERMLWIRGEATSAARVSLSCEYGTLQKSLDRAIKALNLVLQAGGFGLVVLDLAPLMEIAPQVLKRLPFTTWLRLHRLIEGSDTACVLIGAEPVARSAGGVTVQLASQLALGSRLPASGSGLQASAIVGPEARSQEPGAKTIHARVVRSRAMETSDVRVPLSAAAC